MPFGHWLQSASQFGMTGIQFKTVDCLHLTPAAANHCLFVVCLFQFSFV